MLEPNRNIVVRVVRRPASPDEGNLAITLGGTPGETAVKTVAATVGAATNNLMTVDPLRPMAGGTCRMYEARFSPRMPGVLTVTLELPQKTIASRNLTELGILRRLPDSTKLTHKLKDTTTTPAAGAAPAQEETLEAEAALTPTTTKHAFELLVPQVYSGALRVGFSQIWGATDHNYGTKKIEGSDMLSVTDEGSERWNVELVAGYAPFLQAFTRRRGKDSFRLYKPWSFYRLSPYVGVGVLGASTTSSGTSLRWLRTFYLGGEYEVFSSMSIAVAAVLRRTETLATGLTVGGPVDAETEVTRTQLDGGIAVVFNFTPEFFEFATKVGAK